MCLAKPSILSQVQSCHRPPRQPACIALRIVRYDGDAMQVAWDRLHSLSTVGDATNPIQQTNGGMVWHCMCIFRSTVTINRLR